MTAGSTIRRLAFLAVFQLDARPDLGDEELAASVLNIDDPSLVSITPAQQAAAWSLAREAFADRKRCDDVMRHLSPTWPAYRQAAVDRALLRLAHYEITSGKASVALAIDSAVELAKEFSTEKAPGFINALLDAAAKRMAEKRSAKAERGAAAPDDAGNSAGPETPSTQPGGPEPA